MVVAGPRPVEGEGGVVGERVRGGVGLPFVLGHVGGLDGLRGVAVVGVLLFHGGRLVGGVGVVWFVGGGVWVGGCLGVVLCFVLWGFWWRGLWGGGGGGWGGGGWGRFWGRRARRLLPGLFAVLAGVSVYAWLWASPF